MFNATANTTRATAPSSLFWIIEMLLMINLREDLATDDAAGQGDGAYHYGL